MNHWKRLTIIAVVASACQTAAAQQKGPGLLFEVDGVRVSHFYSETGHECFIAHEHEAGITVRITVAITCAP